MCFYLLSRALILQIGCYLISGTNMVKD